MNCPTGTNLSHAAKLIRTGKLVAFATETVYGLGGNALDPDAIAGIFAAKERPTFDPLIVHLANTNHLTEVARNVPAIAEKLIEQFWPGPLTLVLPKTERVPDLVTAGLPSVAVRIPAHLQARQLIEAAGVPLAAPSANPFGHVSPTTAAHVAEQLGDRIDYILDGGPCSVGLESTIVSCLNEQPEVLRLGGLSVEEIEAIVGPVAIRSATSDPGKQSESSEAQLAPGMLKRHYAPRTPLVIVETLADFSPLPGDAFLVYESLPKALADFPLEILSQTGDLAECATNFFAALRRLDGSGASRIVALRFPNTGLGRPLNDRLERASVR